MLFEIYKTSETTIMKALQAVQNISQDNVIELGAMGQNPQAPITLKDMADYIDASYKTLRANWIGYIEDAHEGLQCLAIRENKQLTAFGVNAVLEYNRHIKDGGDRNSYTAMIRDRYPSVENLVLAEDNAVRISGDAGQLTVTEPIALTTSNELADLVGAEYSKRHNAYQQGIVTIENQFDDRAQNRDRFNQFVNALYGDRVEEIKAKSALKEKLEQVVAADEVIEGLDDELKSLIKQVVPAKNA